MRLAQARERVRQQLRLVHRIGDVDDPGARRGPGGWAALGGGDPAGPHRRSTAAVLGRSRRFGRFGRGDGERCFHLLL